MSEKIIINTTRLASRENSSPRLIVRLIALSIDFILVGIPTYILLKFVSNSLVSKELNEVLLSAINFSIVSVIWFFYTAICYHFNGATLGKAALALQVVSEETKCLPSTSRVFLREVMGRALSSIFFLGYLLSILRHDKKALHDVISNTKVIKKIEKLSKRDVSISPLSFVISLIALFGVSFLYHNGTYDFVKNKVSLSSLSLDSIVSIAGNHFEDTSKKKEFIKLYGKNTSKLIADLKKDPKLVKEIPLELLTDSFLRKISKKCPNVLKEIPKNFKYSKSFVEYYVENSESPSLYANRFLLKSEVYKKAVEEKARGEAEKDKILDKNIGLYIEKIKGIRSHREKIKLLKSLPKNIFQREKFTSELSKLDPGLGSEIPENSVVSTEAGLRFAKRAYFRKLPVSVKTNAKVVKYMLSEDRRFYKNLDDESFKSKLYAKIAIKSFPTNVQYLKGSLKKDKELLNIALSKWDFKKIFLEKEHDRLKKSLIEYFDEDVFANDPKLLKVTLEKDPASARHVPFGFEENANIKKQKDLSLKVLREYFIKINSKYELSGSLVVKELKYYEDDKEMAMLFGSTSFLYNYLPNFSKVIVNDYAFGKKVMSKQPGAFKYLGEKIRNNKKYLTSAIIVNPSSILDTQSAKLRNDRELNILAINTFIDKKSLIQSKYRRGRRRKKRDNSLDLISSKFYSDKKLMMLAIEANPSYIQHVSKKLFKYEPFKSKRNELEGEVIKKFVAKIESIDINHRAFSEDLPRSVTTNKKALLIVLKKAPYLFAQVSVKFRSDKEIVDAMFVGWETLKRYSFNNSFFFRFRSTKLKAISKNPLRSLPRKFKSNRKYISRALKISALSYGELSFDLQNDPEFKKFKKAYERASRF